ncbi:hypothetical protein CY35_03G112100 [Sphagnum magellanicum]|nr:hypothetical protein CY35_03G112100 [Sphagnum magellanicum]
MKPAQVQEEEDLDQILEKGIHSMLEEAKGSVQQEELLLEQGLWGGDEGQAAFSTRQSFAVGFAVATVLTTQTAILHMEWRSCGNRHLAGKSLLPPRSSHLQCQQVNHPAMVDQEEELQEEEEDPQILSAATASAAAGSITPRPLNWKTRLCNKWETTGQCPFGDKCHFAHGSDELQMYGGGPLDPNAPAPTISDSGGSPNKSPSETGTDSSILYNDAGPRQRQLNVGASQQNSSRGFSGGGLKAFTNWKGPTDISTIYGDWIDEEEEWEHDSRGDQESLGAESNAKSVEQLPLPHQQQNVAFFRGGNGRHISRQSNNIQTHGFSSSAKNGGAGHVTGLLGVEPG